MLPVEGKIIFNFNYKSTVLYTFKYGLTKKGEGVGLQNTPPHPWGGEKLNLEP